MTVRTILTTPDTVTINGVSQAAILEHFIETSPDDILGDVQSMLNRLRENGVQQPYEVLIPRQAHEALKYGKLGRRQQSYAGPPRNRHERRKAAKL